MLPSRRIFAGLSVFSSGAMLCKAVPWNQNFAILKGMGTCQFFSLLCLDVALQVTKCSRRKDIVCKSRVTRHSGKLNKITSMLLLNLSVTCSSTSMVCKCNFFAIIFSLGQNDVRCSRFTGCPGAGNDCSQGLLLLEVFYLLSQERVLLWTWPGFLHNSRRK